MGIKPRRTRETPKNYSRNLSIELSADLMPVGLLFTSIISNFKRALEAEYSAIHLHQKRIETGEGILF